jgi:glycolate oxidase FAD binding subunit
MPAIQDWLQSPEVAQFGSARAADARDDIDGISPSLVVEPTTPEQIGRALAWASRERLLTVIRGGGSKLGWGRAPQRVDVVLSTAGLNGPSVHRHGDLTATAQAGVTLAALNRQLAEQGQWLPVDTAFDGATIGGIVATNDSGPLRCRYGTPRDLLIGITLALTDGRLVKSGGHVVKNVAGYDLGKLMSGSFGTLAAIIDATFKLSPVLPTRRTIVVEYTSSASLSKDVAVLSASQLEPVAFDVHVRLGQSGDDRAPARLVYIRFATSPDATDAQVTAARDLFSGTTSVLVDWDDAALWADQLRRPWAEPGAVIRFSWLPAALPQVLAVVDQMQELSGGVVELTARATVGAGFLRVDADDGGVEKIVSLLRGPANLTSNVVVLREGLALKQVVDPWGPAGGSAVVLRALKNTFDPGGILSAGRGPI